MMNSRKLDRTGLHGSELCLGTMHFGWRTGEATSWALPAEFRRCGGNFVQATGVRPVGGAGTRDRQERWALSQDRQIDGARPQTAGPRFGLPASPGGLSTGRFTARVRPFARIPAEPGNRARPEHLAALPVEHGMAISQIALARLPADPTATSPIAGVATGERMRELAAGTEINLSPDECTSLSDGRRLAQAAFVSAAP